jgi:predicted secreted protein
MTISNTARSIAASIAIAALAPAVRAQTLPLPLPPHPVVTVSASATSALANDRMHAWLRAEADNPDPAVAANEVNSRMAKALARAKAVRGIDASTTAYTSYQVSERNQPSRWRVSQTLSLEGADFSALAALVSKLQGDDGLVLSGMSFSVSAAARQAAEDALTQQAIKAWQARAQAAATGFGSTAWRAGRVSIQTGDSVRPQPMFRTGAVQAAAAPIATEAGNTDVTVTITGDAILGALTHGALTA